MTASYVVRRVAIYLVTAWVAITLDFFLPRLAPGDPVQAVLAGRAGQIPPQAAAAIAAQFGVDTRRGLWPQYLDYWDRLLHGDLGISLGQYPTSVAQVISGALW